MLVHSESGPTMLPDGVARLSKSVSAKLVKRCHGKDCPLGEWTDESKKPTRRVDRREQKVHSESGPTLQLTIRLRLLGNPVSGKQNLFEPQRFGRPAFGAEPLPRHLLLRR
jgi:hypothetical protein